MPRVLRARELEVSCEGPVGWAVIERIRGVMTTGVLDWRGMAGWRKRE